jgi:6-phosphofructokinase 1
MNTTIRAAILFSGGDAPGMNTLLRAFVRLGRHRHGATVFGVKDGYLGLVHACRQALYNELHIESLAPGVRMGWNGRGHQRHLMLLDANSVSGLAARGGIALGAARCEPFKEREVRRQVGDLLGQLGVSFLAVCGGEGSLAGAARLAEETSLQVVGIPATIDNDVEVSETSLGFDTAVNTILSEIRRCGDTAGSHHRVQVLETMGRGSGQLAHCAALASGAEIVVIPERGPLSDEKIRGIGERIEKSMTCGRRHAIVVVSEGVSLGTDLSPGAVSPMVAAGPGHVLAKGLQEFFLRPGGNFSEVETRASVLGHLQRGGPPSAADAILAARFAEAAWRTAGSRARLSGILALAKGRIRLLPFGTRANRTNLRRLQQIYRLQKDVSKFADESTAVCTNV